MFFAGEGLARLVNQSDSNLGVSDIFFSKEWFFAGPHQNQRLLLS